MLKPSVVCYGDHRRHSLSVRRRTELGSQRVCSSWADAPRHRQARLDLGFDSTYRFFQDGLQAMINPTVGGKD